MIVLSVCNSEPLYVIGLIPGDSYRQSNGVVLMDKFVKKGYTNCVAKKARNLYI